MRNSSRFSRKPSRPADNAGGTPALPARLQLCDIVCLFILVATFTASGCSYNMSLQPRYSPMSRSNFFSDQRSERPVIEDTVATNQLPSNSAVYTGKVNGTDIANIPVQVNRQLLERGRDRYDIYCSPCHSLLGNGEGMVVQRGFVFPPSYHTDRLRQAPDGHFFSVMTEGIGRMWSYANRVDVPDRWAVTAYIRALQLSQAASVADVPQPELQKLLGKTQ